MNGSLSLVNSMGDAISKAEITGVDIIICPPAIFLGKLQDFVKSIKNIHIGAQNCYFGENGAYTGELSASMLQQFGCKYVIIGHSERRSLFAESSELVAKKVASALMAGVTPIICFGETKEERDTGHTFDVIKSQLAPIIQGVEVNDLTKCIIAYEPIWAIGTGITATSAQAEEVHSFIRAEFTALDKNVAEKISILYGGSVKPDNAKELFSQSNIDGGLIGGASLKEVDFISICKAAER